MEISWLDGFSEGLSDEVHDKIEAEVIKKFQSIMKHECKTALRELSKLKGFS